MRSSFVSLDKLSRSNKLPSPLPAPSAACSAEEPGRRLSNPQPMMMMTMASSLLLASSRPSRWPPQPHQLQRRQRQRQQRQQTLLEGCSGDSAEETSRKLSLTQRLLRPRVWLRSRLLLRPPLRLLLLPPSSLTLSEDCSMLLLLSQLPQPPRKLSCRQRSTTSCWRRQDRPSQTRSTLEPMPRAQRSRPTGLPRGLSPPPSPPLLLLLPA
mmetsp:Transcript_32052/g.50051  ORF Transcript_32052/g.50051 Transcript_32052/m.50051 type:complete len:211 (+) Transcript_32052:196-828(+)